MFNEENPKNTIKFVKNNQHDSLAHQKVKNASHKQQNGSYGLIQDILAILSLKPELFF
jgi:hypothetical protein